uniref:hypothetical protein n=1 Tax=Bartonella sp. CL41QHWL TaxID=3243527 RepID=UPI0035D0EFF6
MSHKPKLAGPFSRGDTIINKTLLKGYDADNLQLSVVQGDKLVWPVCSSNQAHLPVLCLVGTHKNIKSSLQHFNC